jgi:hypothetical protein
MRLRLSLVDEAPIKRKDRLGRRELRADGRASLGRSRSAWGKVIRRSCVSEAVTADFSHQASDCRSLLTITAQ